MKTMLSNTLLAAATLLLATAAASAANLPHLRTAGFDYDENIGKNPSAVAWLATHHDLVIGAENARYYDQLKAANPNVTILGYVPFQTVLAGAGQWMEKYAKGHGMDPEDLYCHYDVDTTVLDRDGTSRTVKGFPNGSAANRAESRVMSTWWHGSLPNVCPPSATFRKVFTEYAKDQVSIDASKRKFLDGVLLDTFEGSVDNHFTLQLANVAELKAAGAKDETSARTAMIAAMMDTWRAADAAVAALIGRPALIVPNAGDVDNVYQWYPDVYGKDAPFRTLCVEFLITSAFDGTHRIDRLKQLYDDMTDPRRPRRFIVNSQTNYDKDVPFGFTQFVLAAHALINNTNGWFSYHKGSAGFYGARDGDFRNTHWHPNLEVDLGAPVVRKGRDLWGARGTDRAFVLADGGSNRVLAREYSKGLVVANFGSPGWANIGKNPSRIELPGTYRRVLEDNTLGPPVRDIALGWGEGALLVKPGIGNTKS